MTRRDAPADHGEREAVSELVALTYELLDAHADTSRLAGDDVDDLEWRKHLRYLRDLQRIGRGVLARAETHAQPTVR